MYLKGRNIKGTHSVTNIHNNKKEKNNLIITELIGAAALGDIIGDWTLKRLDNIQRKTFGRVLTSAGWAGTAGAAADGILELFEDLNSIIKLPNIAADSILNRDRIIGLEGYIPSKHKFEIECIDAMSNTGVLHLSFLEQRAGESLVGKIQGAETTLFESLPATVALGDGQLMESTKELGYHMVDENFDRFVSFVSFVGGTAVLDSGIEFTVDGDFRGSLYNCIGTALTIQHNSWFPANIYIPKGATFDIACIDAIPAASKIGLKILRLTDSPMAASIEAAKPEEV